MKCVADLLREIHAAQEVLVARIGTKIVDPEVGPQELRKVGGFFLVGLFQVLEGLVFVP